MQKGIRSGRLETAGNVAVLAHRPIVRLCRCLVAIGARIRNLSLAVVAAMALDAGMAPFQPDGVVKEGIQVDHRPGLAMTR